MNTYRYPKDLVGPLRESWGEWHRHEADAPELPDDESLAMLLETAYHASFTLDEQRRTRIAIVVCDPEDADAALQFSQSRPCTVHELMRLGPVASGRSVMIGVTRPGPDAPARIWGLCGSAFMQLTIAITGAGALEVGRNDRPDVTLRGGKFGGISGPGLFGAVSEFLHVSNEEVWKGVTFGGGSWSPEQVIYPGYLLSIASAIAREGHGGALLIIPDDDAPNFLAHPDWVKVKYACDDNSLWEKARAAIRGYDEAGDEQIQRHAQVAESAVGVLLARIARLGAVDGAVLLTDRLRLLGFGAEVTVQSDVERVVRGDGRMAPIEDFGTRHRSAFRFCSFYPAGLALVCSQDGGVKAIRKTDGVVRLFED